LRDRILEIDEFVRIWDEQHFNLIQRYRAEHKKWTSLHFKKRWGIYIDACMRGDLSPKQVGFDQFDADMRVPLSSMERVVVDFEALPFGRDNIEDGIYRRTHGHPYYLGVPEWFRSGIGSRNYLTTEQLMTEFVRAAYRKLSKRKGDRKTRLWCRQIDPPKELLPISVDLFVDKRASARKIAELAREITDANPNAWVICDGVKGNDRVLTFQSAKGANHLAHKDIYIIVTHLNPYHYAELNVVGQWLGIPDVIDLYYKDQISQAVGRNKGFRDDGKDRKTVVITSPPLATKNIFAPPAPEEPSPEEDSEESELRKLLPRRILPFMGTNEFTRRSKRPAHIRFNLVKNRPW
jgi:hypothetical protein